MDNNTVAYKKKIAEKTKELAALFTHKDEPWLQAMASLFYEVECNHIMHGDESAIKLIGAFFGIGELQTWDSFQVEVLVEFVKYENFDVIYTSRFAPRDNLAESTIAHYDNITKMLEILTNHHLNGSQMKIIYIAYTNEVDVKMLDELANPSIPYDKMNYLAECMKQKEKNLVHEIAVAYAKDTTYYSDTTAAAINMYSFDQIYEICAGCLSDIAYEKYMNPFISAEYMGLMRHAMSVGCTADYTGNILTITNKE